ncbi:ribonuclease H-like domain-containing protein [Tanacetum coccineum]
METPSPKRTVDGVEANISSYTAEESLEGSNELNARGTQLMALPNEHQLKFNTYKCTKTLIEAIEKSSEGLDQKEPMCVRLQKLINQLEILGETISQEDMNLKLILMTWKRGSKGGSGSCYMRARRFLNNSRRKINANGSETIGFNKSKVECYNSHKKGHFTRECRALRENRNKEPVRRNVTVETTETKDLVAQDGLGLFMFFTHRFECSKNLSKLLEIQVSDKFKTGVGFDSQVFDSQENDSFNHLIRDCDFYEKKMVEKTVWNNARRVNHQNSQRMSHPHPKENLVPKVVLMKSGIKTLNTAGQNFQKQHNLKEKVNTVKGNVTTGGSKAVVSDNKGNEANVVKASACLVWRPKQKVLDHGNLQLELQEKGVIDSGCARHMTGNKSFLPDYEEINGRFVAFRGDPKGGRITGKGKISTGKLDFEDVYFVKEIKFNLFSVSQICDKKNSVLFTDTECVVLSPNFKLLDENHVLLRVPRKDNMYSVDLKNRGNCIYIPPKTQNCIYI